MIRYNLRGEQNVEHDSSHKSPWIRMKRRWHARQREILKYSKEEGSFIQAFEASYTLYPISHLLYTYGMYTHPSCSVSVWVCVAPLFDQFRLQLVERKHRRMIYTLMYDQFAPFECPKPLRLCTTVLWYLLRVYSIFYDLVKGAIRVKYWYFHSRLWGLITIEGFFNMLLFDLLWYNFMFQSYCQLFEEFQ